MSRIRNLPFRLISKQNSCIGRSASTTLSTRPLSSLLTSPQPQWSVNNDGSAGIRRQHLSTSTCMTAGALFHPLSASTTATTSLLSSSPLSSISIIQTRGFAIKRSRGKVRVDKKGKQSDNMPLMNEHLVKRIMAQSRAKDPEQVQLRLVVEEGTDVKPRSEETSLAEAIQISLDLGLDLVEIDLNNPAMPVVRAVEYDAKVYRTNKEKAKKQIKDPASIVKEFRFKARTADYDMQRKLNGVLDALKKGHKCQVQATCPSRLVNNGVHPNGAMEVMERILSLVGSEGDPLKAPENNVAKTMTSVILIPRKAQK